MSLSLCWSSDWPWALWCYCCCCCLWAAWAAFYSYWCWLNCSISFWSLICLNLSTSARFSISSSRCWCWAREWARFCASNWASVYFIWCSICWSWDLEANCYCCFSSCCYCTICSLCYSFYICMAAILCWLTSISCWWICCWRCISIYCCYLCCISIICCGEGTLCCWIATPSSSCSCWWDYSSVAVLVSDSGTDSTGSWISTLVP